MKQKRKILASILAALTISAGLIGCGKTPTAGNQMQEQSKSAEVSWSETVEGRELKFSLKEAPKRAVSMSFATTEMMLTLGLETNMAGTAFKEEDLYPPLQAAYDKVPVLAEKWPSYEEFMAVKPDFTTGWEDTFTKRAIPAEKIPDVPIWVPDSMQSTKADLDMLFNDMLMLGKIFRVEDRAQTWVDGQRKKLAEVQAKLKEQPKKRVFVFDSDDGEPFTAFEGYTTNVLRLVGAENVMSGQGVDKTWAKASWESFVAANPDYIIIVDYDTSFRNDDDFNKKIAKMKANPQLQTVTAIKENNFIRVKLSEICPGVRTVDALERIAAELHTAK